MSAAGSRKLILGKVRQRKRLRAKARERLVAEGMMQLAMARLRASDHRPKRPWWRP